MPTTTYGNLIRTNRNFRLFWGGQIVSQLGDWFNMIAVQSLLLQYTGKSGSIAGFMVAAMLPHLVLGPVAGVIVDRYPRRTVMIVTDLARAGIALGLLGFRGPDTAWVAYACVAGLACFAAVFEPARIATLPNITADHELLTANALSAVTWSILLTSGALVGGLVARFCGADTAFVLNSLSFAGSALFLWRMEAPRVQSAPAGPGATSGFGAIREGLHYVLRDRELSAALTAKLGWGLAGGVQTLLPVFGQRLFPLPGDRGGQLSLSLLMAAGGLGTALGPILARRITGQEIAKIRWAIAVSFLLGGLYLGIVSAAQSLGWVAGFLFLSRMHGSIVWVFSTVLLQMQTEDRYRGRVFAAEGSLFTLGMMISNVLTAAALDQGLFPVSTLTLILGSVSLLVGVGWVIRAARSGQRSTGNPPVVAPRAQKDSR